jgi:hypothetical protein
MKCLLEFRKTDARLETILSQWGGGTHENTGRTSTSRCGLCSFMTIPCEFHKVGGAYNVRLLLAGVSNCVDHSRCVIAYQQIPFKIDS